MAAPVPDAPAKAPCDVHGVVRDAPWLDIIERDPVTAQPLKYRCKPNSPCRAELPDLCDLCQKAYAEPTLAQHIEDRHPSLIRFTKELVASIASIKSAQPTDAHLKALGEHCRKSAVAMDGGPEKFAFAMRALDQARLMVRSASQTGVLFMFGSVVTMGVWDGESDIDLTLVDPDAWTRGEWPAGGDEAAVVKNLCRHLRDAGFLFDELEPVLHTRVPVLRRKFEEKPHEARKRVGEVTCRTLVIRFRAKIPPAAETFLRSIAQCCGVSEDQISMRGADTITVRCNNTTHAVSLYSDVRRMAELPAKVDAVFFESRNLRPEFFAVEFDMSCRAHGIRNSLLLRSYMEQNVLVRAGSIFVKKWSKRCGLNNSMKGFLTSYAVQILWIYFLIQKRKVDFVPTDRFPVRPDPSMSLPYLTLKPDNGSDLEAFDLNLGKMLSDFFFFYACEFDWQTAVVSISVPTLTTKERLGWTEANEVSSKRFRERVWYRFCIEDPFEENLSLGRHLSPMKMLKVMSEFVYAASQIRHGDLSRLLSDRTSTSVESRVRKACARRLVGQQSIAIDELIADLQRECLSDMAAFEVEHQVTKLFEMVGVDMVGDKVQYSKKRLATHFVADESWRGITSDLAQKGPVGLLLTPEVEQLHVHESLFDYHPESRRLFDSIENMQTFASHFKIAQLVAKREERADSLDAEVVKRLKLSLDVAYNEQVARAVLASPGWRPEGRTSVVSTPSYIPDRYANRAPPAPRTAAVAAPAPEPPKVVKSKTCTQGACAQCKVSGIVWATSNPQVDPYWYCDACWKLW